MTLVEIAVIVGVIGGFLLGYGSRPKLKRLGDLYNHLLKVKLKKNE